MINKIKEHIALRRFQRKLRQQAQIDRAFFVSARESFSALITTRTAGAGVASSSSPLIWRYATVAIVAVLALTSGAGVFAEKLDVSPANPLYSLKRIAEQVQLEVSTPVHQVQLHKKYAQRRAKEIVALTVQQKPQATPVGVAHTTQAPQMKIMLSVPRVASTLASPSITASLSKEASLSLKIEQTIIKEKKEQITQLKNDLEKEAQTAVTQSELIHLSSSQRLEICRGVVTALRETTASSSARLAGTIESRCHTPPENR